MRIQDFHLISSVGGLLPVTQYPGFPPQLISSCVQISPVILLPFQTKSAAMAKYLITTLVLAASALADDAGAYAAPQGGYAAPSTAYAPSAPAGYGAPDSGYGAPAAEYAAESYEQPYDTYEAAAGDAGGELFDLSKILELLPLFLAVFAAIIVAQLFAPLLGMLFNAKVGLLGGVLTPLGGIKIDAINAILSPFSLTLCNTGTPLTQATGRSSASGFELNKDLVDNAASFLYKAISGEWHERHFTRMHQNYPLS